MDDQCTEGRVSAINETHFQVVFDTGDSCKGCGMRTECSGKTIDFEKQNFSYSFKLDQRVSVEFRKLVQTSLIIYLIPILFLFGGIAISRWLFQIQNELVLFGAAFTGLAFGLVLVGYLSKALSNDKYKVDIKPVN